MLGSIPFGSTTHASGNAGPAPLALHFQILLLLIILTTKCYRMISELKLIISLQELSLKGAGIIARQSAISYTKQELYRTNEAAVSTFLWRIFRSMKDLAVEFDDNLNILNFQQ